MASVPSLVIVIGLLAAWSWSSHVGDHRRRRSPWFGAFTASAASILFVVAGAVGYKLSHGVPFTDSTAWTEEVLWSQIWVGIGLAVIAVPLWRAGLRSVRESISVPGPGSAAGRPRDVCNGVLHENHESFELTANAPVVRHDSQT